MRLPDEVVGLFGDEDCSATGTRRSVRLWRSRCLDSPGAKARRADRKSLPAPRAATCSSERAALPLGRSASKSFAEQSAASRPHCQPSGDQARSSAVRASVRAVEESSRAHENEDEARAGNARLLALRWLELGFSSLTHTMVEQATTGRSLPSLPLEILLHITRLALPGPGRADLQARYEILRSFSLVNSAWRELAQKEMLVHLTVRKDDQQHWSQYGVLDRHGASGVRRLDFAFLMHENFDRVLYMLERCKDQCRHVRLHCGRSLGDDHGRDFVYGCLQAMPSEFDRFAGGSPSLITAPDLQTLSLAYIDHLPLARPPATFSLASLHSLMVQVNRTAPLAPAVPPVHQSLPHPDALPNLWHLRLVFDQELDAPTFEGLRLLLPQVHTLLYSSDGNYWTTPLDALADETVQLRHLFLDTNYNDLDAVLAASPKFQLEVLHLCPYFLPDDLEEELETHLQPNAPQFKRLVLYQMPHLEGTASCQSLNQTCKTLGVELQVIYHNVTTPEMMNWNPVF